MYRHVISDRFESPNVYVTILMHYCASFRDLRYKKSPSCKTEWLTLNSKHFK